MFKNIYPKVVLIALASISTGFVAIGMEKKDNIIPTINELTTQKINYPNLTYRNKKQKQVAEREEKIEYQESNGDNNGLNIKKQLYNGLILCGSETNNGKLLLTIKDPNNPLICGSFFSNFIPEKASLFGNGEELILSRGNEKKAIVIYLPTIKNAFYNYKKFCDVRLITNK